MTKKKKPKKISTEDFDAKFERGEDVSEHLEADDASWRLIVDFPGWMADAIRSEAERLSINKQALVKTWLADRIRQNELDAASIFEARKMG